MKKLCLLCFVVVISSICAAQRLPQIAVPEHYQLTLVPDFTNNTFSGEETIEVRILKATSKIVLNSADIKFSAVSVTGGNSAQHATVTPYEKNEMVTLTVEKQLSPGPADIEIKYTGILNDQLRGFYLGHDEKGEKYAVTQFEATDARRAFPSFDEPDYKATFNLTIVAPKDMAVISNSKTISDTPGPGEEKHTVHFATTPKMSSYLLAVAVGHFESIEGSADGIPIRVWTTPGKKELGRFALEAAEHVMQYYNHYFAIKYPYGKLDLIGLPDFSAGAMENTACITFRDVLLLLNQQNASVDNKKEVASVIAHEMAHQWFGDLVTMQWWDDVWLNEGFATWMSSKPIEAWKPEWQISLDDVKDTARAMDVDSLANTRPIHQAAETPAQILELFDGIAYQKTAAVLNMLESYLGPETFRAGVNLYLKQHEYANAVAGDFWSAQATASHKPVDKIMPTFVEQPGVPLVSVNSHCSGNKTTGTLTQQRYFFDPEKLGQDNDQLWMIPVCLKGNTAGKTQQCELLTKKTQNFTMQGCSPWIFANTNAKGYYRSEYTPGATKALAHDAEASLNPAERMMLLSDTWAAVRVGHETIGDYLTLAQGLQQDRNWAVVAQLAKQLTYIGDNLVNKSDRDPYDQWVSRLMTGTANALGWTPRPDESSQQKELRATLLVALGYTARDPKAITAAHSIAVQALENPSSVDRSLATAAFQVAANAGDSDLYDKVMSHLQSASTPDQYDLYLRTLARFTKPELVEKTLQYAISSAVRSQDAPLLLARVLQNPAAEKQAWEFIQSHWTQITNEGGPFSSSAIVEAAGTFCDSGMHDELRDFFSTHKAPAAERTLKQSLERINYCVDLKSHQGGQLSSWLQQHNASTGE